MDIIAQNVIHPLVKGLFLSCPELYHEASAYYFEVNTFQLSLCDPIYSPYEYLHGHRNLKKRLRRIQNLHVDVGPLYGSVMRLVRQRRWPQGLNIEFKVYADGWEYRRRWGRFVELLVEIHGGQAAGRLLRNLVVVDRFTYWSENRDRNRQRREFHKVPYDGIAGLSILADLLIDEVGTLTIESRSGYLWGTHGPVGEYPYEVLETKCMSPRKSSQPCVETRHDKVKLKYTAWTLENPFPPLHIC